MALEIAPVHLSAGGVSVVLAPDRFGLPAVVHWGAALEDRDLPGLLASAVPSAMNSSLDEPRSFPVLANRDSGWSGTPVIEVSRESGGTVRALGPWRVTALEHDARAARIVFRDDAGTAAVELALALDEAGVLRLRGSVVADGAADVEVEAMRMLLPLPARAAEVLDFTGRWSGERRPQRAALHDGSWVRRSLRGRPGHDSPYLTLVGTPGFGFRRGELWAAHVAWSGNQEAIVERLPEGAGVHSGILGGGEALDRGEARLAPGERYDGPEVVFAWSPSGIDGIAQRLHASLRARPAHPRTPRPLILNTWEAVYFDQGIERLTRLAEVAASVGVERFVLDDGWFRGRRDDGAGLGDWFVDAETWPAGLAPLSEHVHSLGMQFGLWFEPEMVNPDSDLARAHPGWLLEEPSGLSWRHQSALDLSDPDAAEYVLDRLDRVVSENGVDFIKWDHNRDLHRARRGDGSPSVHAQTVALYAILDELRRRHPGIEVESCASGGARPDLGILQRTDRVWASDTNDPLERQEIQRWTQLLLPPELVGTHLGPPEAHTTHRHASLGFREVTALFGHAGIEWDLTRCTPEEVESVRSWAAVYKELRPLLHTGITVNGDDVDAGALLHGVVAADGGSAAYGWARLSTSATAHSARVPLPGLVRERRYRVSVRHELGDASRHQTADPRWMDVEGVYTGAVLAEGLPLPVLNPGQALLLTLTAVDR
ncbi:MAG: alpha-galactosidase [Protaetiibacter sp.]